MKRIIVIAVCLFLVLTSCTNIIGTEETTSSSKESTAEKIAESSESKSEKITETEEAPSESETEKITEIEEAPSESETEKITETEESPSESESTEITTEKETEVVTEEYTQRPYEDMLDADPDLDEVDYTKLSFVSDISFKMNEAETIDSRVTFINLWFETLKGVAAYDGEMTSVSNRDEAFALLDQYIKSDKVDAMEYSIMIILCYDNAEYAANLDLYYSFMEYSEKYKFGYSGSNYEIAPQDSLLYIKKELDLFHTTDDLLNVLVRYTRYSGINKIIICSAAE